MPKELPPYSRNPDKHIIPIFPHADSSAQVSENELRQEDKHPFLGLYEALQEAAGSKDDKLFIAQALARFKRADELIITGVTTLTNQNLRIRPEAPEVAFRSAVRNFANRVSAAENDEEYPLLRSNTANNRLTTNPEIYVSFMPPLLNSGSVRRAHDAFLGRILTHTDSILSPKGIYTLQPLLRTTKNREPVMLHTYMKGVSLLYNRDANNHIEAALNLEAVKRLIEMNPQDR